MAKRSTGGGDIPSRRVAPTQPNKRAVLTTETGPGKIRKLRALNPLEYITKQAGEIPAAVTESKISTTAQTFIQRGLTITRGRRSVRRLFRKDPYNKLSADAPPPFGTGATEATMSVEAGQVDTLNENPSFHPEKGKLGIRSARVKRQPQASQGGNSDKTHGSEIKYNKQTAFGGKRLKRR